MDLYHNDMSTCAQKVRVVLFEKGLQATLHHLNLRAGDQNTPEYRRLNPNGVVPTLVDRGEPIVESTVICEYLDDAYPDVPLRPLDPLGRARMRWWTMQPDAGFHKAVGLTSVSVAFRHQLLARGLEHARAIALARPDPETRERLLALVEQGMDAPGVAAAIRRYDRFVADMAQQLRRTTFLAGAQFSLADAMALPYIVRLQHLGFDWWWQSPQRAPLASWLQRCEALRGYQGIAGFLDAGYLSLMRERGLEAAARVRDILAAT